jgi:putative transposase
VRFAAIEALREHYPLSVLCSVLQVSVSGYHEWRGRSASSRQLANERLVSEIRVAHAESFGTYGSPRIHASFQRQGRRIGRERIRRLMQQNQIVGRHRKKRCRTTDSNHPLPIAPNLLQQNFTCERPDTVWLADISYIPTGEGFLYLAAMKDLCTRKIVGWAMSARIDAQLVLEPCTWRSPGRGPLRG